MAKVNQRGKITKGKKDALLQFSLKKKLLYSPFQGVTELPQSGFVLHQSESESEEVP